MNDWDWQEVVEINSRESKYYFRDGSWISNRLLWRGDLADSGPDHCIAVL